MMKKLVQGSILKIPLLYNLGFAYAKYIDLTILKENVRMPEAIKVFDYFSKDGLEETDLLREVDYLLEPILVAGLRPTLKKDLWGIIGEIGLNEFDKVIPDFKSGNETFEDLEMGNWYLVRDADIQSKTPSKFEDVKHLQTYMGEGTGSIEIRLTMYYLIRNNISVDEYFNLDEDAFSWNYKKVLDSPALKF